MKIIGIVKQAVQKLDLFCASQFLRFKGEAESKTLTGGVVSLAIIIYLIATFSSMIIDTFDKILISAVSDTSQANQPTPVYLQTTNNASSFMLGVEVWHHDLTVGPRYFDVQLQNSFMYLGNQTNDTITYTMQPCTKTHWSGLSNIDNLFEKVQMNTWLCMPLNITPIIFGKYSSDLQTSLTATLSKCKNATDPSRPCAPQSDIDAFLQTNGQFFFTPYFLNPLVNPQNSQYLSYYLQDKYYTMFGPNYGMEMYIYNADYSITTDESILPFQETHTENGSMVTLVNSNSYLLGNSSDIYANLYFYRAPESYIYSRTYQKIIDTFSYIGGLLGAILILVFIVNFYNEYAYEIIFAASLYKHDPNQPIKRSKYNIFYYFLQLFYTALRILKIKCQQKKARFFYQTRKQVLKQLDVKYLLKRIHVLESAMSFMLTKPQQKGIMLLHDLTLGDAKKIRRNFQLKRKYFSTLKLQKEQKKAENNKSSIQNQKKTQHFKISSESSLNDREMKKKCQLSQSPILVNQNSNTLKIQSCQLQVQNVFSDSQQSSESTINDSQNIEELDLQSSLSELVKLKRQSQEENNSVSRAIIENMDWRIKRQVNKLYNGDAYLNNRRMLDEQSFQLNNVYENQIPIFESSSGIINRQALAKKISNEKIQFKKKQEQNINLENIDQ